MAVPRLPRLLLAVVLFTASLFAFDRVFFAAFEHVFAVDTRSDLRRKLEGLADKARYQMLILGTSRTFEAVHPAPIREALGITAFKEAFQGKGPRYNYEFYQLYERIVGRPKWVVYGIDYFVFTITSERWAMSRFDAKPGTARQDEVHGPLLMLANKEANDRAIVRGLEQAQQKYLPTGYDPERYVSQMEAYLGSTGAPGPRSVVPASYQRAPFPPYPGAEGEYLSKLLDQWEREGVAVLLIDMPDYIGTYETNYQRDAFHQCIRDLIRGRPDFAFISYSDPRRFPLDDAAYFGDGGYGWTNSHVSRAGAARFARLFIPDLGRFVAEHPGPR